MPNVGVGYVHMHSEQEKEEEVGILIAVAKDSKAKMIMAKAVPSKGVELRSGGREENGGVPRRRKIITRSDNEPAILALKEAVRGETDVELALEAVPVGDHQTNGLAETAAKNAQGQFRVSKDALDGRAREES